MLTMIINLIQLERLSTRFGSRSQVIGHDHSWLFNEHLLFIRNYSSSKYTGKHAYLSFKETPQMKTNKVFDKDIKTISKLVTSYFFF